MHSSKWDTGELLLSQYECNCTAVVGSKAMVEPLQFMLIFQGNIPVVYKDQWPCIGGFPSVLYSNACSINDVPVIIKHCHRVLNPWLQTINVSVSNDSKSLLIFDGFLLHLNIDILKKLWVDGMLVLLCMTNTSHEINVKDLVNFGIA